MRPSERSGEETRVRILEAAMELFGRDGFDATTVRAIGERCGITDAALYYHFPSKRSILTTLWGTPLDHGLTSSFAPPEPLTAERLDQLVDRIVDGAARQDSILRIQIRAILSGDRTAKALRDSNRAYVRMMVGKYFETIFDPEESAVRLDAFMMFLTGFVFRAQIEYGSRFVEVTQEPAFRDEARRLVRAIVALPAKAS